MHSLLQIKVRDDGPGFKEGDLDLATNAYFHDNPTNEINHYGLGLYISKLLCEKHGGKITLANAKNGGAIILTEFCIH